MHSGTVAPGSAVALIVVTDPQREPGPLAAALSAHQPELVVRAVWAGDPQRRPASAVPWLDLALTREERWERILVTTTPSRSMWIAAAAGVRQLLDAGVSSVVVLEAGAVAVVGGLGDWLDPPTVARLVPRIDRPLPPDGLGPTEADLAVAGAFDPSIVLFGAGSVPLLEWLEARLVADDDATVGTYLALAGVLFDVDTRLDKRVGVGPWRWNASGDVAVVVAPHFDRTSPWVLDPRLDRPPRIDLVGNERRGAVLATAAAQLHGPASELTLPGGIVVDATVRELVVANRTAPAPWSRPAAFRQWLEARYWFALHARRRDLGVVFREPVVADRTAFDEWCRGSFIVDDVPFLIRHRPAGTSRIDVAAELRPGVNLLGYLTRESSLGDVGRRMLASLHAGHVPTATVSYERTGSPVLADPLRPDQRVAFDTTLAIVNADQFPALRMDHPELFAAGTRLIGYWFWELETVVPSMVPALSLVDEIWAGSRFVVDAFARATDRPVRWVPITIPEPVSSGRARADFAVLAPVGRSFVFVVAFDHFSITERKNPIGAIRAFQRAFAPCEGPVLVVKSMHARERWVYHQEVVAAAEGRPDIVFWDERLEREDQMAVVAAADCLVSLHRSEGLGLHLAEAMWLGTPTIATRYSGNLDFQDDDCAVLIDASLVHVTNGQGIFPSSALWADPDLDQAAAAMRAMVADEPRRRSIAAAAVERMRRQPSLAETGRRIAELAGLG